jgi:pimeloyl-ACP methyl ester carboxylesterase
MFLGCICTPAGSRRPWIRAHPRDIGKVSLDVRGRAFSQRGSLVSLCGVWGGAKLDRRTLSNGISVVTAGDPSLPAILLLHGFPSSSSSFRDVIPRLSQTAYVIAPDLPGFGQSEAPSAASFSGFGEAISEVLTRLRVGPRVIYLHDYGAPVGLHVAMNEPDRVLGLIVQNANAHLTGLGPNWADTLACWERPDAENEAAATAHVVTRAASPA